MRAKLKKIRKEHGHTQQSLADSVRASRSHYAQIETGDKNPSLKLAIRIKEALNYHDDDIFDNVTP